MKLHARLFWASVLTSGALLLLVMFVLEPWKTILAVLTLAGWIASINLLGVIIATLAAMRYRRPAEPWLIWYRRFVKSLDVPSEPLYNVRLACGCRQKIITDGPPPKVSDCAWCARHRWFGPARRTEVTGLLPDEYGDNSPRRPHSPRQAG